MKKAALPVLIVALAIPIAYAAWVYPSLPPTIPVHFNFEGKPDGFGERNDIWFPVILLTLVSAGTYLLMKNLPRIDPKKTAGHSPVTYERIALAIGVFISAVNIIIVYSTANSSIAINRLLLPLLGLFFCVLGYYMRDVAPNYFVGFRLPWTLESADNWRETHRLVSRIWMPGGLLIAVCCLVLPARAAFVVFIALVSLMVIIPAVFSYRFFRKNR